jgi:hypothetical protein
MLLGGILSSCLISNANLGREGREQRVRASDIGDKVEGAQHIIEYRPFLLF